MWNKVFLYVLLALLIALTAWILLNRKPRATIAVSEETLLEANDRSYDYLSDLSRAEAGDASSVARLVLFGQSTDTASAFGHANVMIRLLHKTGEGPFLKAVPEHSTIDRTLLARMLDAGEAELVGQIPKKLWRESYPSLAERLK